MATIRDVAKEAGVSLATVSYIINGKGSVSEATRARVVQAIQQLNYVPNENARSLKSRRSPRIGLVIADVVPGFYPSLIAGFTTHARQRQMHLEVLVSPLKDEELLKYLLQTRLDAYVVLHAGLSSEHMERLQGLGVPLVFLDREIESAKTSSVLVGNFAAMVEMVDYLVKAGYRKPALMYGDRCYDDRQRYEGYIAGLNKYGIPVGKDLLFSGGFSEWTGYQSLQHIFPTLISRPDVIVCTNDSMGWGCIQALGEMGLNVPRDIAITGFDGFYVDPRKMKLTSIANPTMGMAQTALNEVFRLMRPEETGRSTKVPAPLIVGNSTTVRI